MNLVILLIFLLPLALAAMLIFRGIRGFRVGDHPVCRRCGFDLFGQPVGTVVCGECGTSLTTRGNVVIGHRQRRPMFIVAGLIILVPILFAGGVMVWGQFNSVNWLDYAPTRLVIWLAGSPKASTRTPALAKLNSEVTAGALNGNEINRVADAGLAFQADLSKPWDTGWGDLLETLQATGKLSDERWKQYLTQAMLGAFDLRLRKSVRHGDDLPWEIERQPNRAGSSMKLQISFDSSGLEWLSQHGSTPHLPVQLAMQTSLSGSGSASSWKLLSSNFPEPVSDGVQRVHVHGVVKVGFPVVNWHINPIVSGEVDLRGSFLLLPANTPVAKDAQQALHDQQVRKSLEFDASWYASAPPILPVLSVQVTQNSWPLPLDIIVLARADGREVHIGEFGAPAQPSNGIRSSVMLQNNWPGTKPRSVDIVVRSNPDFIPPASWSNDDLWNGEIVFKDVPVQ